MSRITFPGSSAACKFSGIPGSTDRAVTLSSANVMITKPQKVAKRMEVQGGRAKLNLMVIPGEVKLTAVTDDPAGAAEWLQNVERSTVVFSLVSGRKITLTGVTIATEEGVGENVTEGTTNELTFVFDHFTDTDQA
jgi:hypothetical protein